MFAMNVKKSALCLLFALAAVFGKTQLVIDTDMAFDVDDVGAVCVAHALEKKGFADIRGIVHNTGATTGIGAISVLNNYFGRGDIPIGAYKGNFLTDDAKLGGKLRNAGPFINKIVKDFGDLIDNGKGVRSRNDVGVKSAVETYREILSKSEDNSIVIASIGFLINLKELLKSEPDEISELSGKQLVEKKVKHLSLMGGQYPYSYWPEFNFSYGGSASATQYVLDNWPKSVPIIFNGYEIGTFIQTGFKMFGENEDGGSLFEKGSNPCADAYRYYCAARGFNSEDHDVNAQCTEGKGRASWDLLTVLHAVFLENPEEWEKLMTDTSKKAVDLASKDKWKSPWKKIQGTNFVSKDGGNSFSDDGPPGNSQSYLEVQGGSQYDALELILDELLSVRPTNPVHVKYNPPKIEGLDVATDPLSHRKYDKEENLQQQSPFLTFLNQKMNI